MDAYSCCGTMVVVTIIVTIGDVNVVVKVSYAIVEGRGYRKWKSKGRQLKVSETMGVNTWNSTKPQKDWISICFHSKNTSEAPQETP